MSEALGKGAYIEGSGKLAVGDDIRTWERSRKAMLLANWLHVR